MAYKERKGQFNKNNYLTRTKRNHFWVGGEEGQLQINKLTVGVAGLGGMGSNVVNALARLGVGEIRIADPDIIESSNINRQIIAFKNTVGQTKAQAMWDQLINIGDDINIKMWDEGITKENASDFVNGCDIIVDEIDVFPTEVHVHLHRAANKLNIPIYSGYIVGLAVHLYKFHGSDFTIEDFFEKEENWKSPTSEFLIEKYGTDLSKYMSGKNFEDFKKELDVGDVPIFGSICLAGHSLVSTKVILDALIMKGIPNRLTNFMNQLEVMPNYYKLDLVDNTFEKLCVHDSTSSLAVKTG